MSDNQTILDEWGDDPDRTPGGIRDHLTGLRGRIRNMVADAGLDTDWWGKSPFDLSLDEDIYVYQFVTAYSKGTLGDRYDFDGGKGKRPARTGSPSPEVQFKTGVYVIGEPTAKLERRIRDIDNGRLVTLFNTREYATYMAGFGFSERRTYTQRETVSAREVKQKDAALGMPWWEVEAYDKDGDLQGYADGRFNPFTTTTTIVDWERGSPIPDTEVWKVGKRHHHDSGDRYQISPPGNTGARDRAKAAAGKTAIINGFKVGSLLSGGRIRLKVEHASPSRAKYASRKDILGGSGTPYQALSQGANMYKIRETDDEVVFSTTKPRGFTAPDPDDIAPDAVGVETGSEEITDIILDDDEPTQFTVEYDNDGNEGRFLGLYDPPVVRDIESGTVLN